MSKFAIDIAREALAEFCKRNHIRKLSIFGSVLREDFTPDSDIDVLVEFEPEHIPGLIRLAGMERELSTLFGGRKIDMMTPKGLSPYIRDEVLAEAVTLYEQAKP